MKILTRLWRALETIPGLLAVPAFWRAECGDEFEFIQAFLRPTDELGGSYPCPLPTSGDCPRKIIDHGGDDVVAICRDPRKICPAVHLDARAALVHKLDVVAFVKAIGAPLGIRPQPVALRFPGAWEIGISTRARTGSRPVFLLIQTRRSAFLESLRRLALEIAGRFTVLAPTEMFHDVQCQQLVDSRGITFISLEQHIAADGSGGLVAVDPMTTADEVEKPAAVKVGRPRAQSIDGKLVKKIRGDLKQEDFARRWKLSADVLQTAEIKGRATDATIGKLCRAAKANGLKLKPEDFKQIVPQKPQI